MCLNVSGQNHSDFIKTSTRNVKVGSRTVSRIGKAPSSGTSAYTKSATMRKVQKSWSDGSTSSDILLSEDFSAFKDGTEDTPDTKMLASFYGDPGMYIDKSLTAQDTWAGSLVYSAGGKIALISPNEYTGADLDTPLGDYSGDLTITFKVKALENSDLFVNVLKGGYARCEDADTKDGSNVKDYRLYPKEGWKEVTLKISNNSADNDGFIQFHSYGKIIIDDYKVTTTANFIAPPKLLSETKFTKNGFTINWEPTRIAFNYYIDLYKKVYTSNNDSTITEDFENVNADGSNMPNGWRIIQKDTERIGTVGQDSTKGLILNNGDTIETPYDMAKYKDLSLWMRIYDPDPETNYEVYETSINIDARTINGWQNIGQFSPDAFFDGKVTNLIKTIGASKYYGIRLSVSGLPKGDYVALDNFKITTGKPATLETVDGDFPGYYYAKTKDSTYTFNNLDSLSEYYYSVKAHYLLQYSDPQLKEAFGVAKSESGVATDITANAYTAHWEAVPKATRYLVNNYGVYTATTDEADHVVLNEDFSKVNSSVTDNTDPYHPEEVGNTDEVTLDAYSDFAGWTGVGTTMSQGMIGVAKSSSQTNYMISPSMYLDNGNQFKLYIKAYGTKDATLIIQTNNKLYSVYFKDAGDGASGVIDNTFIIPDHDKALNVIFYTLNKEAFIIDAVKVSQDIKAGNNVYTYLSSQLVKADTLSCTFSGLDQYPYKDYAFTVTSYYDLDNETAISDLSEFTPLTLVVDPTGIKDTNDNSLDKDEIARFNINGVKLNAPVKGINIVKLSNGRIIKELVK